MGFPYIYSKEDREQEGPSVKYKQALKKEKELAHNSVNTKEVK